MTRYKSLSDLMLQNLRIKFVYLFSGALYSKSQFKKRSVPLVSTKILLVNEYMALKGVLSFHYNLECFYLTFLLIKWDSLVSKASNQKEQIAIVRSLIIIKTSMQEEGWALRNKLDRFSCRFLNICVG
jgi:hypothetical protein